MLHTATAAPKETILGDNTRSGGSGPQEAVIYRASEGIPPYTRCATKVTPFQMPLLTRALALYSTFESSRSHSGLCSFKF